VVASGNDVPPGFPSPRVIPWSAITEVELLRHGTGTSLYSGFLGDAPVVVKTARVGLNANQIGDVVSLRAVDAQAMMKSWTMRVRDVVFPTTAGGVPRQTLQRHTFVFGFTSRAPR
jgi:hypothetical protein